MKVTVFGGSGFIGYNFVRECLKSGTDLELTLVSTNAANLTNLSRHNLDIRLIDPAKLRSFEPPKDTSFIVNFAHPFQPRGTEEVAAQIDSLLHIFKAELERNSNARLIHVSSMSVYEPFAPDKLFRETEQINPPRGDTYAENKAKIDCAMLGWVHLMDRVQILRPTVVYGPFCRPWTDRIAEAMLEGPISNFGLTGRIQPIQSADISRFILSQLMAFKPGVFNLPGSEVVTWHQFLSHFIGWLGCGELAPTREFIKSTSGSVRQSRSKSMLGDIQSTIRILAHSGEFRQIAAPYYNSLPDGFRGRFKKRFFPDSPDLISGSANQQSAGPFLSPFFEEDRLVSSEHFSEAFPGFSMTPMENMRETMERYFKFRFEGRLETP